MSDNQDFDQRLAGALVAIERERNLGIVALALVAFGIVLAVALAHAIGAGDASLIVTVIGVVFGVPTVFGRTRQKHKELVMPLLAEQLNLRYSKPVGEIGALVPPLVLPDQIIAFEDMVEGRLGPRAFWFADVVVKERKGDNDILFKGFVLSLDQAAPGLELFISDKHYAQLWPKPDDRMVPGPEIAASHRRRYAVWTSRGEVPPDLSALEDLVGLERMFGLGSRLATLRASEGRVTLAVRQSDVMFEIGGLLRTPQRIRADMTRTLTRMSMPLEIGAALLESLSRLLNGRAAPKPTTNDT